MEMGDTLILVGAFLIILGIFIVFAGFITKSIRIDESSAKVGGVVLIGPIPIIFGNSKTAIALAVVGAVLLLLSLLIYRKILYNF